MKEKYKLKESIRIVKEILEHVERISFDSVYHNSNFFKIKTKQLENIVENSNITTNTMGLINSDYIVKFNKHNRTYIQYINIRALPTSKKYI